MLQARAAEWDHRLYNVNRDVAHCFGEVVREVAARLEDRRWPILAEIQERFGVSDADLSKACEGFMLFVASAVEHPKEGMQACMRRSGYLDAPEAAQVAYMAILGTVMSGYFWAGAREATIQGQGPCNSLQDLRDYGHDASRFIMMPRWKRQWHRFRARVSAVWDAIRGRTSNIRPTPLAELRCSSTSATTAPSSAPSTTPDPSSTIPPATPEPSPENIGGKSSDQ